MLDQFYGVPLWAGGFTIDHQLRSPHETALLNLQLGATAEQTFAGDVIEEDNMA